MPRSGSSRTVVLGRALVGTALAAALPFGVSCFSDASNPGPAGSAGASSASSAPALRGCASAAGTSPHVAPGGYYTSGSLVCTADGTPHLFHGVDRPSLEWSSTGENISLSDFQAMASWHANVVRIALNQDWWLSGSANYDPSYAATVGQAVTWAEEAGLDVILDLHWSDRGDLSVPQVGGQLPDKKDVPSDTKGYSVQQPMADQNSLVFWKEVADRFKGDGHVLFELYNEPNSITWPVWLHGGPVKEYQAVGMQDLYDTVRGEGADNVVIAGGIDWAFDLRGVAANPIVGYNVMYASHVYKGNDPRGQWDSYFGYLAAGDVAPVILTEFGDGSSSCDGQWDTALIAYANQPSAQISWTAWAWYPAGCSFPALLDGQLRDWTTPSVQGAVVQQALGVYPAPTPFLDAGGADATEAADARGGDARPATADATLLRVDGGAPGDGAQAIPDAESGADAPDGSAATAPDATAVETGATSVADGGGQARDATPDDGGAGG